MRRKSVSARARRRLFVLSALKAQNESVFEVRIKGQWVTTRKASRRFKRLSGKEQARHITDVRIRGINKSRLGVASAT